MPARLSLTARHLPRRSPQPSTPFGQLPILEADGLTIGQSTAIANYVARRAGKALEGESDAEFAMSQMLMAEGEDLYAAMQARAGGGGGSGRPFTPFSAPADRQTDQYTHP